MSNARLAEIERLVNSGDELIARDDVRWLIKEVRDSHRMFAAAVLTQPGGELWISRQAMEAQVHTFTRRDDLFSDTTIFTATAVQSNHVGG